MAVVANAFQFGELSVNSLKEFRQILEPGLAELAAERRTDEDLRIMEEYLRAIRASIDNGDPDQTKAVGFHCLIANAAHNDFISALMKAVMQVFQQVLEPDLQTAEKDIRYNELFYEHIKNHDGVKVKQLMKEHFDTLEKIIEQRRSNGDSIK